MDETDFQRRADALIARVAHTIEDALPDADVERDGGVLNVELDGETYVLNKHGPTRQLWLSSPVSGAWHFAWNGEKQAWLDTRRAQDLVKLLEAELSAVARAEVSFGR